MKKLIGLVVLASTSAFATDYRLGDLNFIQKSSTFLLDTGINYNQNSQGQSKTTGISLDNKFSYGLNDHHNLGLSLAYMFSYKTKTGSSTSDNETALSDITLNDQYRLGQTSDGLVIDLMTDLRISTKEREINGDTMLPVNQGNHSLDFGINLGRKSNNFEWRSKVALRYNHEAYYSNANDTGLENYQDSTLNATIGSDFQFRVDEKLAFGAGFDLVYFGAKYDERENTGSTNDTYIYQDPYTTTTLRLFSVYNLSETAALNFRLSYTGNAAYETRSETNSTHTTSEVKTGNNTALFIGGKLLF